MLFTTGTFATMGPYAPEKRSAQVLLRSASGEKLQAADYVAENVARFAPAPNAAAKAAQQFAERGFVVGPVVGNSFSIEGPVDLFEQVFGRAPEVTSQSGGTALPLERLPQTVRDHVEAVVVPEAPEWMN
jgi:hypothetical protein